MTSQISAKYTLWINRFLALAVTGLCFGLPGLLSWYHSFRSLSWQSCAAILLGYYLCVPVILYALWCIEKLIRNILLNQVFITHNVRLIRRIRRSCGCVSLICLPAALFYPPLIFLAVIMAFLALAVNVVKDVMAAAVEIREENDLTI